MPTHLRLHKERPSQCESESHSAYLFPEAMAAARRTLVAGVVSVPAIPEPPHRPRFSSRYGVLARIDNGRAQSFPTEDLMSQVERTLDEMQAKIDQLKEDADNAYKFPAPTEDDRPWAA